MDSSDFDALPTTARRDWLAALLLRQPDRFMPRLAAALARWQTLSRAFRRRLQRRAATGALAVALLLAMTTGPLLPTAHAASIDVDDGMVVVDDDGFCSLREALVNAGTDSQLFATAGECAAGLGDDTINLPVDGDFLVEDAPYGTPFGDFGLGASGPDMVTIEGNGSTIRRDAADPDEFSILVAYFVDLTINEVTISGGSGILGGGILTFDANLALVDSTISDNSVTYFGGGLFLYGGGVLIQGSTISDNTSGYIAGGIGTYEATLDIVNSTISGNSAPNVGGISVGFFIGPGSPSTATITNSTITDNHATYNVGGIAILDGSELTLSRSIVSGNRAGIQSGVEIFNFYNTVNADDHNVFGHRGLTDSEAFYAFAPGASDVNATSDGAAVPLSGILSSSLADNGGPTLTHNLVLGSPALDMVPDADCAALPTDGVDQRGAARPFDVVGEGNEVTDTCDIGAVEADAPLAGLSGVFMSATAAGTTGDGLDFGSEDIIRWDGSSWSMFFDGSDAGLMPEGKWKHNINAFHIDDGGDIVMSFTQNARFVPGIAPKVDGMDLVKWDGSAFSLFFDGSDVGLTNKTQEKIDALHILPGSESPVGGSCQYYLLISTQGPGKVKNPGQPSIRFGGEDVLGFCLTNSGDATAGVWHLLVDGSAEGMPKNATDSISFSDDGETMYLTTKGAFAVDAAVGGPSMVYEFDMTTGTFSGPVFDAPAEGLPEKVDGLQIN